MLCNECNKRDLCTSLCPEAEAYVNQDEVSQRELNISNPFHGKWPEPIERSKFTPMELKILHAFLDGKTRKEISQELEITRESLRKHIGNIRRKRE